MKKAVLYARYSSDKQTEQSIEGQVHVCQKYAKENGYQIINMYVDRATTGTNDNRESFQKMISDSANKEFEYVLVYKLDRFSRNRYDSATNKAILRKNGVKVISATELITDTPEGIIMEGLLESMAEYYSAELSQKILRGMNETRKKGLYTGGTMSYGWDVVDRKYVVNPIEANVVHRIFDLYEQGTQMVTISKMLEKEGVRNKYGGTIKANRIGDMLRNPKYKGLYTVHGIEYPNVVPGIISPEQFDRIQEKLNVLVKPQSHGEYSKTSPYILTGKVYCDCGGMYVGDCSKKKYYYYVCNNRKHIGRKRFNKEELENLVIGTIVDGLRDSAQFNEIVESVVKTYNNEISNNSEIVKKNNQLKEIETKLENLARAIEMGMFNELTKSRVDKLLEEKKCILQEIEEEKIMMDKPIYKKYVKEYLEKFIKYDYSQIESRRYLLHTLVDKIIIKKDPSTQKYYLNIICNGINKKLKKHTEDKVINDPEKYQKEWEKKSKKKPSNTDDFGWLSHGAAYRSRTCNL